MFLQRIFVTFVFIVTAGIFFNTDSYARSRSVPAIDTTLRAGKRSADTLLKAELMKNDTLIYLPDEKTEISADTLSEVSDTLIRLTRRQLRFADTIRYARRDTLPISRLTFLSLVAPGLGQIYNKQYGKLPVLYAGVAGLTYLGVNSGKKYRDYTKRYNQAVEEGAASNVIDDLNRRKLNYRTASTLSYIGAGLVYLYFIGDGVVNYPYPTTPAKRATTLSMIFPGAGQIYNKSYWKVPIVYGGFAVMGFIIDWNNRGYQRYKQAYIYATDNDPNTKDEFNGTYSPDILKNTRNAFRRNRDLSIIITGAFYILQVIDAHVDSYLRNFEVDDDLSLRVEPVLFNTNSMMAGGSNRNGFGMSMKLNF